MKKMGRRHEKRRNANWLKKLLGSFRGSNQDHWCEVSGQQWNMAALPSDGYNDGRVHVMMVTFLHKSVFRLKALVVNWHKPREKKTLEHMAHGLILWLDAMTHEGERISITKLTSIKQQQDGQTFKNA